MKPGRHVRTGPLPRLAILGVGVAMMVAARPATAQAPAPAKPDPGKPAAAAPEPTPHEKSAMKIAGLVAFVANSCPQLKPDYARFRAVIGALGVTEQDLAKQDMKIGYLGYTALYQKDAQASCERARLQFGPKGATVPDLFALQP